MRRKIIALLLATMVLMSVAIGCGGTQGTNTTTTSATTTAAASGSTTTATTTAPTEESFTPMEFTTFTTSQEAAANPELNMLAKALKEKFNITLKTEYIAQSTLAETMKLRIAGNEDPDVQFNTFGDFDTIYGPQGYFIAFDDLFDKLPNWRSQWNDAFWAEYLELTAAPDGKHYSLRVPMGNVQLVGEGWLFRMSTIKKMGLTEVPGTTEELYNYLKAIKQEDPNAIPFSHRNVLAGLTAGFEDAFRTDKDFRFDEDYGQLVYGPATDKWREMLKYLNKLYKEGLISKEFSTQTADQWSEQVGQGKVHVLYEYFAREGWANNLTKDVDPDANWLSSEKFINAYPDKKLMVTRYSSVGASSARISSRNNQERVDRLLKVFDWLATEEGQIKTQFGQEGLTYRKNAQGELEYLDHIKTPLYPDKGTDNLLKYNLEYRIVCNTRYFYFQGGEKSIIIGKKVLDNNYDYFKPINLIFSDADKDAVSDAKTVLTDKYQEYAIKFISGQLDPNNDAAWNDYIKVMNDSGLAKILPIYQKEYANSKK